MFTVRWRHGSPPGCFDLASASTDVVYILYIDGSGSVQNPNEQNFILGGVSLFKRQIYHLTKDLDDFVNSLGLDPAEEMELHGRAFQGTGGLRP